MTNHDDDEYELEAPDPEVIAAEARRDKALMESAREAIDIDAIYREADRNRGAEVIEQWFRNFRFRFQVKHLLIGTALVAIILTVTRLAGLGFTISVGVMLVVVGVYAFVKWEESKQEAEADRKREELYARRREQMRARGVMPDRRAPAAPIQTTPVISQPSIFDEAPPTPEPFRIRFSMQTLLIIMTGAAITLGLIRIFGGATPMASVLGLVAVTGLVVHALGFEPPQLVVLGWWLILVLYVILSLMAAVFPALA